MVLEKNLESPLDCKEIKPVHPKGDQSWLFIGRTDAEVKLAQLCPTLCDLMDCSPPGSFVHGILQARIMEWVGLDNILKSRDITLPAKVRLVKAMVFSRGHVWM